MREPPAKERRAQLGRSFSYPKGSAFIVCFVFVLCFFGGGSVNYFLEQTPIHMDLTSPIFVALVTKLSKPGSSGVKAPALL